jgi:hypothetical protein
MPISISILRSCLGGRGEEELWRTFKPYSQSMDVNKLDKAMEEIAKLLGVKVVVHVHLARHQR